MPKSRSEMLTTLVKLIVEYLAFQRGRPDLPQGNIWGLSQDELEQVVTAFQLRSRCRCGGEPQPAFDGLRQAGLPEPLLAIAVEAFCAAIPLLHPLMPTVAPQHVEKLSARHFGYGANTLIKSKTYGCLRPRSLASHASCIARTSSRRLPNSGGLGFFRATRTQNKIYRVIELQSFGPGPCTHLNRTSLPAISSPTSPIVVRSSPFVSSNPSYSSQIGSICVPMSITNRHCSRTISADTSGVTS